MTSTTETVTIPKAALALLKPKGYFERFHALRYEYRSDYQAWEALECEMHVAFGIGRYESYETFKRMKNYYQMVGFQKSSI